MSVIIIEYTLLNYQTQTCTYSETQTTEAYARLDVKRIAPALCKGCLISAPLFWY